MHGCGWESGAARERSSALAATLREAPLVRRRRHNDAPALACLLALRTRDRARVSAAGLQGGARAGGAHRLRGAVCVFDPSTGRELEPALLLRCVLGRVLQRREVVDERLVLKSTLGARRKLHAIVEE